MTDKYRLYKGAWTSATLRIRKRNSLVNKKNYFSLPVGCLSVTDYPFRAFAFISSVKALLKPEAMSRGEE